MSLLILFQGASVPPVSGDIATGQGGQTIYAVDVELFQTIATTGQGSQSLNATGAEGINSDATAGQASQSINATATESILSTSTAGQASQSINAAIVESILSTATARQASQSLDLSGVETLDALFATGQGSQSLDGILANVLPAKRGGWYGWSGTWATKRKKRRKFGEDDELVRALDTLPEPTPDIPADARATIAEIREIMEPFYVRTAIDYKELLAAKSEVRRLELLLDDLKLELAEQDDEDAVLFLM